MTFARYITEQRERRQEQREANLRTLCLPNRSLHKGVIARCDVMAEPQPKEPEPVRDESYRRWVASLPCYQCRIEGYSNAAHPNSGKTKGVKRDDDECFPLCVDRPGVKGCHSRFDQFELVSRADMPEYERAALEWTRQQEVT